MLQQVLVANDYLCLFKPSLINQTIPQLCLTKSDEIINDELRSMCVKTEHCEHIQLKRKIQVIITILYTHTKDLLTKILDVLKVLL